MGEKLSKIKGLVDFSGVKNDVVFSGVKQMVFTGESKRLATPLAPLKILMLAPLAENQNYTIFARGIATICEGTSKPRARGLSPP